MPSPSPDLTAAVHLVDDLASRFGERPGSELAGFPRLVAAATKACTELAVSAEERQFIASIDGETTAPALVVSGLLEPGHAAQLLCALALLGGLVFEPRHPEAAPCPSSLPPPLRVQEDPARAAVLFDAGREALRAGALAKAAQELGLAHALAPRSHLYDLYAAWVRFCLLEDRDRIHGAIPGLEERVLRVLRDDRRVAFAHYVYGRLQLLLENHALALRALRVAVQLDPDDLEAQMYCRLLEMRAGSVDGR